MKRILISFILVGTFVFVLSAGQATAITCYKNQGSYDSASECASYCPSFCTNYSTYSCDGGICYCVDDCAYGNCGYESCGTDEIPQWSCSEGGEMGTCQYTCSYDEFCASGSGSDTSGGGIRIQNPLGYDSFEDLVNAIIKFIYNLSLVVAPIMFVISGIMFVTSAGDPEKAKTARRVALYTVIGFAVILSASGLIKVLQNLFSGS